MTDMFCYRISLLGVKTISSHALKTGSWFLSGVLLKVSDEHPRPSYMGVPPGRAGGGWIMASLHDRIKGAIVGRANFR